MRNFMYAFFGLLTLSFYAQDFPDPYCDIDDPQIEVEEITAIEFAEEEIINEDSTAILVDETETVIEVIPGETYTLKVQGNTNGNFDNAIFAFADWNQNEVLDDEGEAYEVGVLSNSDGEDGVEVSYEITIPEDAEFGTTRMRISKIYTDDESIAIMDPCAIDMDAFGLGAFAGYGQAVDVTLEVVEEEGNGFPDPYCDIDDPQIEVEEITAIEFAEEEIINEDSTAILVDETETVIEVIPGETYTLKVQGNTNGNFDNAIFAFADWNQNEVLDDEGEAYEVGVLSNSDGEDGVEVSYEITIPEDAESGTTRMRISKIYTDDESIAIMDPCAIDMDAFGLGAFAGYGQAVDITLEVGVLSVEKFDENALTVYPIPANDVLNIAYKTEINTVKVYNLLGQEVIVENPNSSDFKVDLSNISSGNYIVKIFSEESQHTFNMNKQ